MSPDYSNALCPKCRQRAPIVLRGISAECTACGAKRLPFTAKSLNLAGKGSRIGGAAARLFGWVSVIAGTSMAAFLGLLFQSLYPDGFFGYAFAIPVLLLSLGIGIPLILGGRKMGRHGDKEEKATQVAAIRSMAAHHRGVVTAKRVAVALALTEAQADEMLTDMARDPDENVSLDLDDDGNIYYLFGLAGEELAAARWRIETPHLDPRVAAEQEAAAYEQQQQIRRGYVKR